MHLMSLEALADIVGGALSCGKNERSLGFDAVSTDTRTIKKGELFIALKGEHFIADDFVDQAQQKGALAAIVASDINTTLPTIKVVDVQEALAKLASSQRQKSAVPIAAITGSNGKTTVKEMLASILAESKPTLATQGNFNNHIGVPLTLLRLNETHQVAVVEMGASAAGDIEYLCEIAKPDVAVINNVAAAHIAGFGSLDGVASAKSEIISGLVKDGIAVLNADEPWFDEWVSLAGNRKVISFGLSDKAEVRLDQASIISRFSQGKFQMQFELLHKGRSIAISLNLMGQHNSLNAAAAYAVALALGVDEKQIVQGLANMQAVNGRLQALPGINQATIINDSYNANPSSLEAALKAVDELKQPVWLVLGDFEELGSDAIHIHKVLGELIAKYNVQKFFAVGEKMAYAVSAFEEKIAENTRKASCYDSKEMLLEGVKNALAKGSAETVILIKGSRSHKMEEIVEQLLDKGNG